MWYLVPANTTSPSVTVTRPIMPGRSHRQARIRLVQRVRRGPGEAPGDARPITLRRGSAPHCGPPAAMASPEPAAFVLFSLRLSLRSSNHRQVSRELVQRTGLLDRAGLAHFLPALPLRRLWTGDRRSPGAGVAVAPHRQPGEATVEGGLHQRISAIPTPGEARVLAGARRFRVARAFHLADRGFLLRPPAPARHLRCHFPTARILRPGGLR